MTETPEVKFKDLSLKQKALVTAVSVVGSVLFFGLLYIVAVG